MAGYQPIPGRIEAEDFDTGDNGTSYHDVTAGNSGGQYRDTEDADITATLDAGTGYKISSVSPGEWLEYTVGAASGAYDIDPRVASIASGRRIIIKLDDITLDMVTVPSTGNLDTFSTVTSAGHMIATTEQKILRLEFPDGNVDLNWVEFIQKSGTGE